MLTNRKAWAITAKLLDKLPVIMVFFVGFLSHLCIKNHVLFLETYLTTMFGYFAGIFYFSRLWGRCPLRLANEMLLYGKEYYEKTPFWIKMENKFGEKVIPYIAIIQPVMYVFALNILVLACTYKLWMK